MQKMPVLSIYAEPKPSLFEVLGPFVALLWEPFDVNVRVNRLSNSGQPDRFSLSTDCPHCHRPSVFLMVTEAYHEDPHSGQTQLVAALQCQGCQKYVLAVVVRQDGPWVCREFYPLGTPNDSVEPEVPDDIRLDFQEALRCRFVNAYNATVEMCRRAVETSCEQLGADPSSVLEKKIDWLFDQGKINAPLRDTAHTIRLGGNRGAHPPKRMTKEEADAVIEFTRHYFYTVYVIPKRLDKYDFSRSAAKIAAMPAKTGP